MNIRKKKNRKILSFRIWTYIRLIPSLLFFFLFYLFSYLLVSEAVIQTLKSSLTDALDVYSSALANNLYEAEENGILSFDEIINNNIKNSIEFSDKYRNSVYLLYDFLNQKIYLKNPEDKKTEEKIIFGLKQEREIFHSPELENSFYIFKSEVEKHDMYLILLVPTEYITSFSKPFVTALIFISIIISVLFSLTIFFITGSISKPFLNLTDLIGLIESGLFSREFTDSTTIESELVSYRINKMVDEVKQLNYDIYKKEIEKSNEKLKALYAQINPHFLFNTLNSIKSLAYSGKTKEISDITTQLGKMLRYGIYDYSELVSLKQEFDHAESYLRIQTYRNGELFRYSFNLPDDNALLSVPKLILQPLAENYIKHGLLSDRFSEIEITSEIHNSILVITLKNTGKTIPPETLSEISTMLNNEINGRGKNGIGIINVHQRISELFGPVYGLKIRSGENSGTEITIKLPVIRKRGEYA